MTKKLDRPHKVRKGTKNTRHRENADGLTPREKEFVHAYALTLAENGKGNATEAAKMAGCPEASAAARGCGFLKLPHVREAIDKLLEARVKKFDVTADAIVQELAKTGFSNMLDYLKLLPDGNAVVDWSQLSREQAAAISEVVIDEYMEKTGEFDENDKPIYERVKRIRFKLGDKKGSLELLGKHHKMFTDNIAHSNPDGSPIDVAPVYEIVFVDPPPPDTKPAGS